MLRRLDFSADSTIVRRGREGDCMYFVASGEVEVEVDPPVRLGPGSFFGEMALLGSGIRGATVVTTLPTTLLVLEQADFRAFTASHPGLYETIEAEAMRRAAPHGSIVSAREITSPPISQ
jgi:voltage-gated potassium channel